MKINSIEIQGEGFVFCKSNFYSAHDILSKLSTYSFFPGTNKMIGEIDSGIWAVSYLLSMYKPNSENFSLLAEPRLVVNGTDGSLIDLQNLSCYMDIQHPLFSKGETVEELVRGALAFNDGLNCSTSDIKQLFHIDDQRFERPLKMVGNEIFKAMAAIGYCYGREVFCFPWMSDRRFNSYHGNLTELLSILSILEKVIILPVGQPGTQGTVLCGTQGTVLCVPEANTGDGSLQ